MPEERSNKRVWALVIAIPLMMRAAASAEELSMDNGLVRVTVRKEASGYRESYFARGHEGWRLVLESGSTSRIDPAVKVDGSFMRHAVSSARASDPDAVRREIVMTGGDGPDEFVKTISL